MHKTFYNLFIYSLILGFVFISKVSEAQTTFQRVYSVASSTVFNSAVQTTDGGYIISGHTDDSTGFYYISKLDSLGQVQWTKNMDISLGLDLETTVGQTNNGGFYLLGTTNAFINSYISLNLVILDSIGTILHSRIYSGTTPGELVSSAVRQKPTGEFYISARYLSSNGDQYFYIKADSTGNPLWMNTYCAVVGDKEYCYDLEIAYDGGLIGVGGGCSNFGMYIVKTDLNGNLDWAKLYSNNNADFNIATAIKKTMDGGYIVGGKYTSGPFGYALPMLMKIDSLGNFLWSRYYGDVNDFNIPDKISLETASDGGFVMSSIIYSDIRPLLIKTDSAGNFQWAKVYDGTMESHPYYFSLSKTQDDGYMITANDLNNFGKSVGHLIKTDSDGNSGCNETSILMNYTSLPMNITSPIVNIPDSASSTALISSTSVSMIVSANCSTILGEFELANDNTSNVFPNPANASINFILKEEEQVLILNLLGETVIQKTFSARTNKEVALDVSFLSPGIYLIKIGEAVSKFVKE